MVYFIIKFTAFKHTCIRAPCIKLLKRNFAELKPKSKKELHPYEEIHHWKSVTEFSEDILANIIFNKDGLVAINKPYGIRRGEGNHPYGIPNAVKYTLEDAVPYISKQLGYPSLTIFKCPEIYMSGVTLLTANTKVERAVQVSIIRNNFLSPKYWVVTRDGPTELEGKHRLAMKIIRRPDCERGKAVIVTSWSQNEQKLGKVKLLSTEFKVLSRSIKDLCSLVEISSSTKRWHAIRLYASTFLYCPILGDNFCGSLVHKVGNSYVKIDPFLKGVETLPKLDGRILKLLNVRPEQQKIIPAHIHLRKMVLPYFFGDNLTIEAPLMPSFDWTCRQLELRY